MKQITFQLAAFTAAAGKYDPNAPNAGNEDNFYVDDNLSDDLINHCVADAKIQLSECGMIMVVADGMGGMNAGEVASEIAVRTVAQFFSPGRITPEIAAHEESRRVYLESVIIAADKAIKEESRTNPDHRGMGSTIILAWLVGDSLSVSWCGDSRCYRFNPAIGIEMLSRDHSYVQELADKGVITYEQTFSHPQGNIVTRSLGDESGKSRPETRHFKVYQDDIILLCSDGLSGVLFDRECYIDDYLLSNENLNDIINAHQNSMSECREELFAAAERADWYDNVTAVLCKICDGADPMPTQQIEGKSLNGDSQHACIDEPPKQSAITFRLPKKILRMFLMVVGFIVIIAGVIFAIQCNSKKAHDEKLKKEALDEKLAKTEKKMELNGNSNSVELNNEEYPSQESPSGQGKEGNRKKMIGDGPDYIDGLEEARPNPNSFDKDANVYTEDGVTWTLYTVQPNENLSTIARKNGFIANSAAISRGNVDNFFRRNKLEGNGKLELICNIDSLGSGPTIRIKKLPKN